MAALQQFFDAERIRRGWSMREVAKRSKISPSKAYAIVNGDDNVEFETFENIAAAFSMSAAELATAIGKGAAGDDPKRVPIHAAVRQVPEEHLTALERIVRSLVPRDHVKGRSGRGAHAPHKSLSTRSDPEGNSPHTPLTDWYPRAGLRLASAVPGL